MRESIAPGIAEYGERTNVSTAGRGSTQLPVCEDRKDGRTSSALPGGSIGGHGCDNLCCLGAFVALESRIAECGENDELVRVEVGRGCGCRHYALVRQ